MHIYVFVFSQLQHDVVESDKFRKESAFSLWCYLHYQLYNNPGKSGSICRRRRRIAEGEQTQHPSVRLFLIPFPPLE